MKSGLTEENKNWPEKNEGNLKYAALWKKVFQGKEGSFPRLNVMKETRQVVTVRALLGFTHRNVSEDNKILTEVQVEGEAHLACEEMRKWKFGLRQRIIKR